MSGQASPRKSALTNAHDSGSRKNSARGTPPPRAVTPVKNVSFSDLHVHMQTLPSAPPPPPPSFAVSLYDLAVPTSSLPSLPSDTPFVEILQQSRSQRASDDASALDALVASVLRGDAPPLKAMPAVPDAPAFSASAVSSSLLSSSSSPPPRAKAQTPPPPVPQSPAAVAASATLERAVAVRALAQSRLLGESSLAGQSALSLSQLRSPPPPPAYRAAISPRFATDVSESQAASEPAPIPAQVLAASAAPSASVASTVQPDGASQLDRATTPAQLLVLDAHLQKILASATVPTPPQFAVSLHELASSSIGSRGGGGGGDGGDAFSIPIDMELSHHDDNHFLAELDRQTRALEAMLVADHASISIGGSMAASRGEFSSNGGGGGGVSKSASSSAFPVAASGESESVLRASSSAPSLNGAGAGGAAALFSTSQQRQQSQADTSLSNRHQQQQQQQQQQQLQQLRRPEQNEYQQRLAPSPALHSSPRAHVPLFSASMGGGGSAVYRAGMTYSYEPGPDEDDQDFDADADASVNLSQYSTGTHDRSAVNDYDDAGGSDRASSVRAFRHQDAAGYYEYQGGGAGGDSRAAATTATAAAAAAAVAADRMATATAAANAAGAAAANYSAAARAAHTRTPVRSLAVIEPLELVHALLAAPTPAAYSARAFAVSAHDARVLGARVGAAVRARDVAARREGVHVGDESSSHSDATQPSWTPRDFARHKAPAVCARLVASAGSARSTGGAEEAARDSQAVVALCKRELLAALHAGLALGGAADPSHHHHQGARDTLVAQPTLQPSVRRHAARTLLQAPRRK